MNRPEACDLVIRNAYVITMNAERERFPVGAVAIRAKKIVAVGQDNDILERYSASREIDANGGVVHPSAGESIRGD